MTANDVIANLLIPPVGFLTIGLIAMLICWSRRRAVGAIAFAMATGLLVLALPVTARALLAGLEQNLPLTPPAGDPPQAIVVLGGDARPSAGDGVHWTLAIGRISLDRSRAAADLNRRLGLPILVTGGNPWQYGTPVAALMAQALSDDFDTPARWVEVRSTDTWENARASAPLLRQAGIHSVYLVTDAWHMRRALLAFARYGIAATAAPTLLDPWPMLWASEFIPQASAWIISYHALHEWVGLLVYRLRSLLDPTPAV